MAAPGAGLHRFQSELVGDFREQIAIVPVKAKFLESDTRRWIGWQPCGAWVFGEGAQRGAGQLHPAGIVRALQSGDDAKALGVALEAQKILALRFAQLFQYRPTGGGCGEPEPDGVLTGVAERRVADVVGQTGGGHHRAEILRVDAFQIVAADHAVADHRAQRTADAGDFQAVG